MPVADKVRPLRPLAAHERHLLERLLALNQNCFEELPDLARCRVRALDAFGDLAFEDEAGQTAPLHKLPLEMAALDADGSPVRALLLVKGRQLAELQFYKPDGSPIIRPVYALVWMKD